MSTLPWRTAGVEVGEGREEKKQTNPRSRLHQSRRAKPPVQPTSLTPQSDSLGDTVLIPSVRSDGKVEQARSAIHPPSSPLPVVALLSALACVFPDTGLRGD